MDKYEIDQAWGEECPSLEMANLHRYQSPITLLMYYVATPCPFHIATTLRKGPSIKYVHRIFRMFNSLLPLSAFHATYQYCSSTKFAYSSSPFPLAADILNGWPPNWGPQCCAHCTWPHFVILSSAQEMQGVDVENCCLNNDCRGQVRDIGRCCSPHP